MRAFLVGFVWAEKNHSGAYFTLFQFHFILFDSIRRGMAVFAFLSPYLSSHYTEHSPTPRIPSLPTFFSLSLSYKQTLQ